MGNRRRLEAPPGFEPGMEVLQTSALPLGDGADRNWGSKLTWNVRPRLQSRPTATGDKKVFAQGRIAVFSIDRNVLCSSLLPATPQRAERSGRRSGRVVKRAGAAKGRDVSILERETGFEPATSTLARSHSTTELFPLALSARAYHRSRPPAVQNLNRTIHLANTARQPRT